ncbi:MAG: PucR family transcriptional regulator [Anaerolineaceae bacterium]|nr:MAG: PucR family transcriptional regulator [Anaerolineaceae bacterium]
MSRGAMLTIKDALALPAFAGVRVVAGEGGLHNQIKWVHNVGVPDAANWLDGGELVLTTYSNLPPDEDGRVDYLRAMIDKGVAGLVVTVGQSVDRLPDAMRQTADAGGFPLMEVHYTARYVDLARAANEYISQENIDIARRALAINQRLTRLILEGGGIKQLAAELADMVSQSISIETARFEALANANVTDVDEARRYTQQYGRTDPRLVQALEADILPRIRDTLRPVFIEPMPHVGLEMERILAPIVVHGEIYGYMWIIADDHRLSDLDHLAIESGATVAALMMLYQEAVQGAEASLKGNLLARLIQGEMSGANVLTDQALRYNVDLRRPYRLYLIDYPQATSQRVLRLYRDINQMFINQKRPIIVGQYAGQLTLIAQADEAPERVLDDVRRPTSREGKAKISISAVHVGAKSVRRAYTECRETLEICRRLNRDGPDFYYEAMGYLHTLYHAGAGALNHHPHLPTLRQLYKENQADLFHTLEAYLDAGGNGVSTAENLHIHRSTLNYRLQRISEICAVDLSDAATRTNLQIALKLFRMFGDEAEAQP